MATSTAKTNKPCVVCGAPCPLVVSDNSENGVVLYMTSAWVVGNDLFTDGTPRLVCSEPCRVKILHGKADRSTNGDD